MKASDIKVAELKDYADCEKAIDGIEADYRNVVGGLKAFMSGYTVELTAAAKKKIEAIRNRQDSFISDDEEGMGYVPHQIHPYT